MRGGDPSAAGEPEEENGLASGPDLRIDRTLRYSIFDGIGYSVMVGAGETYFIPYAIFLGAPNLILGLLVAFPIFLGSLSQVLSEKLLRAVGSRKRLIAGSVLLQALTFGPMLLCRLVPGGESLLLLVSVCAYYIGGLILGPSWSSLMGDLVEEDRRGEYFGRRNRYLQITIFFSLLLAGLVLHWAKQRGLEYQGYAAVFALAAAARLVSFVFLALHWDPPIASPPHGRTFSMVRDTLKDRDHRRLVLYLSLMNFGVYLSAPFFSTYMLRPPSEHGIQWSYLTYTVITGIAMVFKFLFLPLWGRASDRFGARKCLTLSAWIVCVLPLFWLTPSDRTAFHLGVICFVQALGGFAWAGHELCSFNFLLDAASAPDRPRLVASMNIVNGLMIFLGSSMGALVVSLLASGGGAFFHPFLGVFLLSAVVRGAVCWRLLPGLREVRQVESISYRSLLFRVTGVRTNVGPVIRFFLLPGKRNGHAHRRPAGSALTRTEAEKN